MYKKNFQDIISTQSCNQCTDAITKIYLLIRNGLTKLKRIDKYTDKILQVIKVDSESNGKMVIKIGQEETLEELERQKAPTNQKLVSKQKSNHLNIQTPLICEICSKNFKSHPSLQTHYLSHTRITCPYCQKSLKNNSFYKTHLKTHTGTLKRSFKTLHCIQCSYTTKNLPNLQSHINKNHLNIRPYICDVCKNSFYSKSNLIEHLQIHNKNKELICEFCGEHFSYKKTLNQHLNLHKGLRPYTCEICSRAFVTKSRKNEHAKKHQGKKFACDVCPKKFCLKKDLNKHSKVHNNNEER